MRGIPSAAAESWWFNAVGGVLRALLRPSAEEKARGLSLRAAPAAMESSSRRTYVGSLSRWDWSAQKRRGPSLLLLAYTGGLSVRLSVDRSVAKLGRQGVNRELQWAPDLTRVVLKTWCPFLLGGREVDGDAREAAVCRECPQVRLPSG